MTSAKVSITAPVTRRVMQANGSKNTKPELIVRQILHAMGYRFRLHRRDLPGTPDIVFPKQRKVIEVRGCFWHRHTNCPRASIPRTRRDWWLAKFQANIVRDARNETALHLMGWEALIIWECQIRSDNIRENIIQFLEK